MKWRSGILFQFLSQMSHNNANNYCVSTAFGPHTWLRSWRWVSTFPALFIQHRQQAEFNRRNNAPLPYRDLCGRLNRRATLVIFTTGSGAAVAEWRRNATRRRACNSPTPNGLPTQSSAPASSAAILSLSSLCVRKTPPPRPPAQVADNSIPSPSGRPRSE